ncbi:Histidine kinase [compost metagenome]
MTLKKYNKKWIIILLVVIALIPLVVTAYEVIFTQNKSVFFLGNYNPKISILVISYYILLLCLAVFWFTTRLIAITKIKNEQAKTELMLLKSQVNPHFFFNMLNNLYGLLAKDTKKAEELILKLSDLMRYSIYEGEKETVALHQEIRYLKNYIELHQMRYHKNIVIDFNYHNVENYKVVPLLFIMLLENSFKHGVETLRANAYVKIDMKSFENKIQFTVENNYDNAANENNKPGIGLENLKRRLALVYPNKHKLSFSVTDNVYQAQLTLIQL